MTCFQIWLTRQCALCKCICRAILLGTECLTVYVVARIFVSQVTDFSLVVEFYELPFGCVSEKIYDDYYYY